VSGASISNRNIRVLAIISAYNEADIIGSVIRHLAENGVEAYIIDNHSIDETRAEAERWLGHGVVAVEQFPHSGSDGLFRWQEILERKLAIAREIEPDWVIHHDADEIRYSPWPGSSLRDAIEIVDQYRFNTIDFRLLNFPPVDDGFETGADPKEYFTRFGNGAERDRVQVKCWKWEPDATFVDGGHDVQLRNKNVFPLPFVLCHYPIRGQTHGLRKIFEERKRRFVENERAVGWHVQYEEVESRDHPFLHNPATLLLFDLTWLQVATQLGKDPAAYVASPLCEGPYEGVLDQAGPDEVSGWAWSPERPEENVEVDIWASDHVLATVTANVFRPDLPESGIGSGKYGFSIRPPESLKGSRRCWIWANIARTAIPLQQSPRAFERRAPLQTSAGAGAPH
jgi:hypothetical protein